MKKKKSGVNIYSLDVINSRLDTADEKTSELEDTTIETIHQEREKRPKSKIFKKPEKRFTVCTTTNWTTVDFCKQYKSEDNGKTSLHS